MTFFKVNTDNDPGLAQRFEVEYLPTYFLLVNGDVVDSHVGGWQSATQIERWINESR